MNLERLSNFRGMKTGEIETKTDDIETKNWYCRRYETWLGSERLYCKVRRKHKKRNRR